MLFEETSVNNGTSNSNGDADLVWSRHVAGIAFGTLQVARTVTINLQPLEWEIVTKIVAEEIYVRLIIGDRPPARSNLPKQ